MARDGDVGQAARLQVKLVCAACGQDGVLGIYANGTVYQPEFYLEAAQMMEDRSLPLLNLVWPGLYRREEACAPTPRGCAPSARTSWRCWTPGRARDLRGLCWTSPPMCWSRMSPSGTGETIGFSEGQKLPITRSAGIWHDGMTLKIGYPSKEEGRTRTAERPET